MLSLLLGLLGLAAVVYGLALIYPPAALIVGGLVLLRVAVSLDRPKKEAST